MNLSYEDWLSKRKKRIDSQINYISTKNLINHNYKKIVPLSSFDLTDKEQSRKACHFTNLQPLWAKDNLKKGNKY